MKKILTALTLASALLATVATQAFAQTSDASATQAKTAKSKKTATGKAHAKSKKSAKTKAHGKKTVKAKPHSNSKKNVKSTAKAKPAANEKAQAAAQKNLRDRQAKAVQTPQKMPFSSASDDDDREPELSGTKSAEFSCEMGNKLTIYQNDQDDKHIAIRWNQHVSRLTRVATTTGANRFENHKNGLVWIGIPAKGILLDSRKGQQLANECKNAAQATAAAGVLAAPNS
ncbi:hypothetical protein FHW67_000170 [Herbaspirillum sp. Sphag1AN]|uniref:hypothetical protein n=1 Tax=unclassified Herbaspirillum TaxID=2624150 RepID=UPI0017E1F8F6|nr:MULTISPECIES: hypothetical protein [unclassified Herbaspirillum]MBB3210935.1 hypothetical protein [Herbaspirillum sp. Sphag1AN]MBB3244565.1 hypothetical protein [Herbaspirillum sp. Sphag64]